MNIVGVKWMLVLVVATLAACIEHRPDDRPAGTVAVVREQPKPLKGLRVYEGKIPCADCSGVEQHLFMKGDSLGIFRLTEVFKDASEDGDQVLVTTGHWKSYKKKRDGQERTCFYLSEGAIDDSTRQMHYEVSAVGITMLDSDGDPIQSTSNYTLKLTRQSNPK